MQPKNYFRYTITNIFGTVAVAPFNESDFKIDWTLQDEILYDYSKTLPGSMVFRGATFSQLLSIEQSTARCEYLNILVERQCAGVWGTWFTGRFSLNDAGWDLHRCQVEIKLTKTDDEQCLNDNKSEAVNLFSLIPDRYTARIYKANITVEKVTYTSNQTTIVCTASPIWQGAGTPAAGGWIDYYGYYAKTVQFVVGLPVQKCQKETRWARYTLALPSADPAPGPEWILISTVGGTKTWAKPAILYDCEDSPILPEGNIVDGRRKSCKILGDGTGISVIDNGMKLKDILEAYAGLFCPGYNVKSEFFQINPDTVTGTNYVTGQPSKVQNILVFQKSDVKRPGVSGNATKAEISFSNFMSQLGEVFNVRWRVSGTVLRVEHISYFSKAAGLDLTAARYLKYVHGKAIYSYQNENIPPREEFKFMEASAGDFAGLPILYSGACVSEGGREKGATIHAADQVTTDVELCISNPSSQSNVVDDHGLAFIAVDNTGLILSEPPILQPTARINNTLAWAQLHRDYHKHYRPLKNGIMNGAATTFLSVKPTKKGVTLAVPFCCGDTFNPDDLVGTELGGGTVAKATYSFKNNLLYLDLLYPSENGLYSAPVAVNDVMVATSDTFTDLDVLANDTYTTGLPTIEIVSGPAHGTATVIAGPKIRYDTTGYTGPDELVYKFRDVNNFPSNNALVAINVII